MNSNFNIQRPDHVIEINQQVRKHKEHIGRIKIHPGQTLWELNLSTLEITPVNYDVKHINIDGSLSSEVITKENFFYCVAINKKNATRKFILMCNKVTSEAGAK